MLKRFSFFQILILFCLFAMPLGDGYFIPSAFAQEEALETAEPVSAGKASVDKVPLSSTEAKDLIAVLNDPAQREQLIGTLKSLQKIEHSKNATGAHSVLESGLEVGKDIWNKTREAFGAFIQSIANFKALWPWLLQVWSSHALQSEIFRICIRVALVGVGGWGLSLVFAYLFRGLRAKINAKAKDRVKDTEAGQEKLELVKKDIDDSLEKLELREDAVKAKKKEIEAAIEEEKELQERFAQAEETHAPETLAHAENLAAKQALEEVESQAVVAQTVALSDSGAVKASTVSPLTPKETETHPDPKLSKNQKALLDIADKIQQLELEHKEAEQELQKKKQKVSKKQQNYNEIRLKTQKETLANRSHLVAYALAGFALDLFGIAMFPFLALLIQLLDPSSDARTMAAVWSVTWFANVVQTLWVAVLRALFNPVDSWLRLAAISDRAANFLFKWLRRISGFVAWGLTIIIILQACTLPGSVSAAIGKLVGLTANLMLAWMIFGARPYVSRSCTMIANRTPKLATIAGLTRQLWWICALFFDFALWWVWAMNMRDGYQFIILVFIKTCIALGLSRLLWIVVKNLLERGHNWLRTEEVLSDEMQERFLRYYPALEKTLAVLVLIVMLLTVAIAWGVPAHHLFSENSFGAHLLSSCGAILLALFVGVFIWEAANIFFERHSKKLEEGNPTQRQRVARIRTLQPLFRIILLMILTATVGMTILSELGVNIAPLLASASIFGVAIGFGSQKLVHDFISGVFLLLENALTVGDMVTLNKTYGRVEKLSLRTVHVRSSNGSLNIFPFSSLNEITNFSRGFCRVIIEAGVAYGTKVTDVREVFLEITETLKNDANFADFIIDDLNFLGLDRFGDSNIVIKATLPVTPAGRWPVTYEFNRQIAEVFEKRGIEMPFPMRTLDFPSLESFLKSEEKKYYNPKEEQAEPA
ncbi:mechanosensitive ion channel [Acetobacteraceae bacterium]|nr:mechanosensitive ion channel [Acetobacteraceae bacterium]